ncbi:LptF/LptG family permease [Deinococcus aquiradiocola]|uniref:Permease n=1 Tax=Deinococcus aquiradiocola TaxID=393059 RepID=A0A917PP96_9DEIO|nr:LptF/LptG family permease [Deinococcus aquiradiocola]GGJ86553.1 permease [Deinococcus aquiradiocola]
MRLTRYVTRELIPPLLAGTLLFVAILSFGYFFISAQWLTGVSPLLIARWIGYQLPDTLVKVLPMGVVLMVVVAFGRLSNERELVAVQSGGIGLGRVARPVGVIAALAALLSIWLSLWVAPRANVETRGLYWDTLTQAGLTQLVGKQVDLGAGLSLYLRGYDPATRQMQGVRAERWSASDPRQGTVIFADHGTFENNVLHLQGYSVYTLNYAQIPALAAATDPAALPAAVQRVFTAVNTPDSATSTLTLDTGLSRKQTLAKYADAIGADAEGWPELITKLTAPGVRDADRQNARRELNRKLALPFGNLVLALTALPFALRFGRSLGVSLGIALLIAVAYYLLFVAGLTVAGSMPNLPEPGIWLANIVFAVGGLLLLRRA